MSRRYDLIPLVMFVLFSTLTFFDQYIHTLKAICSEPKMADPSAFYEPEEDELLSQLAIPVHTYQPLSEGDEYRRLQQLEQHAYAQQTAMAQEQEMEQLAALELVPEDVKRFLVMFHQAILENDLPTITSMYESGWNKLTQVS